MNELSDEVLKNMVSGIVTVKRENTDEWMEWIVEKINEVLEYLKDDGRFEYDQSSGTIKKVVSTIPITANQDDGGIPYYPEQS